MSRYSDATASVRASQVRCASGGGGSRGRSSASSSAPSVPRWYAPIVTRSRELLARYERSRDLVQIGAYQRGSDAALDEALERLPAIEAFLRQTPDEYDDLDAAAVRLHAAVTSGTAGF